MLEIKGLKEKIKNRWNDFGIEDKEDSKKYLSKSDRRFIICICIVTFVLLFTVINNIQINRQCDEDMKEIINMVRAYVGLATEDEYDKIAQMIRHDLIFSSSDDIEKYVRYIPNTSDICCTCNNTSAQAVVVSLNTGESYPLDLLEAGMDLDAYQGNMQLSFGYDEISQTDVHISKNPTENKGFAEIERGNGIVSIHKMKKIFCDDCIENILKIIKNQVMNRFIILDTEKHIFYPVEDKRKVQIGNYILKIKSENDDYVVEIESVSMK